MKATDWEFKNRAMVFGTIIGVAYWFYAIDRDNPTALLATWLGLR